ncbi:hypothetical protein GCM10007079_41740 [Nocardiopsis terrae]|nr:hypothetical protein GCM10007079_41740 [Nocardiopsis terrae]
MAVGKAIAEPAPKRANLRAALEPARISAWLRAYDQTERIIQDRSRDTPAPTYYPAVTLISNISSVRVCGNVSGGRTAGPERRSVRAPSGPRGG